MPGRYSYTSSWSRGNDPWFRIGQIDITTTVGLIGLGIISVFMWAIEGREHQISLKLLLDPQKVQDGEIWRLLTWPLVNQASFWTIFLFFILYMLGNQLENLMGRRTFLYLLLALTVLPGLVVTLASISNSSPAFVYGLRFVELGVLIAFAAQFPFARFWPGIPAWGIVSVIVGLQFLDALQMRSGLHALALLTVTLTALVGMRSLGYATDLHWLPSLPLRSKSGSQRRQRSTHKKRSRKNHLRAVTEFRNHHTEKEIDQILDQVAETGVESLSKEQRKRLEQHSKDLRKRRDT
ncbi:MAG: rhomboid family intramembrane serine protease [Actinomycetota bacterium]|nr:rhomboid family intramembrane serine protease [Actinomycetota bacterium]